MRVPRWRPDDLDEHQRALYDAIAGGSRAAGSPFPLVDDDGVLAGPFNAMLLSPVVGDALQRLGQAIRFGGGLSARARELAILIVAADQDSAFERAAHEAVGRTVGLTESDFAAVRGVGEVDTADAIEVAVIETTRLLLAGDLDDDAYDRAASRLGLPMLFELSTLVGYYRLLADQLRLFRVT